VRRHARQGDRRHRVLRRDSRAPARWRGTNSSAPRSTGSSAR
jgi:hypothetical protein